MQNDPSASEVFLEDKGIEDPSRPDSQQQADKDKLRDRKTGAMTPPKKAERKPTKR